MLSFSEALADDYLPAVCAGEGPDEDADFLLGWDVEFFFPELELRPELRLCCGTRPDVVLNCKSGRAVKAHRGVLAEVEYFRSMFEGHEAPSLSFDEDAEALFEVLRWVYCRDATMDKDLAMDVLRLAELYGMDSLADHCARALAGAPAAGFAPAAGGAPTAGDNGSSTASGQHSTKDTDCGDSSCCEMLSGGFDERDVPGGGGSGEHAPTNRAATSAGPAAVRGSDNKAEISQLLAEAVALVDGGGNGAGDAPASSAAAAAPTTAASSSAADSNPPRPVKLKDL